MNVPARPRKLRRKAITVLIAACYSSVYAAPVSPTVVAGQASFNLQGKTYTITNTPNTIINWQGFSIARDELARFVQQGADSKVLNRITGQDPSLILGALQSNGKVFLINPNGVVFGAGSRVDVNGLVASSLNIANADFLAGKNNFSGAATAGKVSNQGSISTPSGGQIFLVAPAVENSGVISAPNGEVLLAAGHTVQLFDSSDPNVQVVLSSPSDQALNLGQVVAQGGRIGVYGALVSQRGSISADSAVRGANGKIVLKASGTMLAEAGSRTSATGSDLNTGGDILLLGRQVGLTGNAVVDASGAAGGGTVLVGGDYQGKNAAVQNAQQAYVGKEALLRADATERGNGGKVVVWSDAATQVLGAISARGGAAGGHGGMVETSGHYLDMQGTVDTRAPKGANGSLLLDPSDVYIALDASTARDAGMAIGATLPLSGGVFLESTAVQDSLLLSSVLQTALLTSDVTVSTANSSGTGSGVINVLSPLLWVTSRNLSLQADSDIHLKSSVTGINGALSLTAGGAIVQTTSPIDAMAVSSLNAIAAGAITLDNNANTIGGSVALAANGGAATLTAVNVNLGASNAAGALSVTAYNGDLSVNGNLAAGGAIALQSSKANGTLTIASGQTVAAAAGDVSFVADKMNLLGAASVTTSHALSLRPYQSSINVLVGGSAADASGTLGLSQAELQRMSVPSNALLEIGTSFTNTAASGTLTVSGALNLSAIGGGGLLLQSQAGDLSINSGAVLTVPGVISLQTIPTGNHRVTNAGTVTSSEGINVYAGKMTLAAGSLNAYTVGLESGNDINLGATSPGSGTLGLTGGDLGSANATQLNVSVNSSHSGAGDITLSAPLSLGASGLTLTAQHNIALDAALNSGGNLALSAPNSISAAGAVAVDGTFELLGGNWTQNTASLPAFSAGDFKLTGGSFLRVAGGDGGLSAPYQLTDIYGLQGAVTLASSAAYVLNQDIDASASGSWSGSFRPLASAGFTGVFDGAGHTISGLSLNRPDEDNVGLFGRINTGTVRDLTLSDVFAAGAHNVGGLAGTVGEGIGYINNVSVSGTVAGVGNVGLLIGLNGGLVGNVHSSGTVYGYSGGTASNIGGLVGANAGQISDAWSDAGVHATGDGYVGGLVGSNFIGETSTGNITRSYASGLVYGSGEIVGGLVGDNRGGTVTLSYATASVSGGRNVGGLAGRNTDGGSLYNVYASGAVHGNTDSPYVSHANIGGLVGELYSGYISSVYSSGSITPGSFSSYGGLIGRQAGGSLSSGYFNLETAGTSADAAGAAGLTAAQMLRQSSFSGFNFDDGPEWRIYDGHTVPLLKNFLTPYEVAVSGGGSVSKVYDGASASFSGSTGTLPAAIHGTLGFDGAVNAGVYTVSGLWSTTYDISYSGSSATLTIDPRPVTAVVTASKTYDGGTSFSGTPGVSFGSGLVGSDTLGLAGVIHFDNKNAGSGKTLFFGDVTLTDNALHNYTLAGVSGTGIINPAALAVSGVTVTTRSYNGEVGATLSGTPAATALGSDVVAVSLVGSGSASFADKNVGSGKAVTVNAASFSLAGADAGNYVVLAPAGLTGEITPAELGISGMTASNRVYNVDYDPVSHTYGRKAEVSGGTLTGVFGSDHVSIDSVSATFSDKNVGSAKPVAIGAVTLGGADKNNYIMGPTPLDITANITPATLNVSLASRAYNNSTAGSFDGATLNGVLSGETADVVTLSSGGASATYADKNVGTGKLVTVGGSALTLVGADAGNYVLSPTVTGDITARTLSTWTATGAGLWSDSANWADGVAPSGANVLAASLGSGAGLITYDSSAGNTSLVTLSSTGAPLTLTGGKLSLTGSGDYTSFVSGALTASGGTLEVLGRLSASNLVLNSGTVSGAGSSYIYISNLTQTGGIVDSTGTVYLGSGGAITTGNIRAHSLTLNAGEGGVVTQTGGSQLVADTLSVTASGNITLANANNHVGAFQAHIYGNGNIALTNVVTSGELQLGPLYTNGNIVIDNTGAVHTVDAITANKVGDGTGVISITAHSPVMIDSTLTGADIGLSASTDIVLGSGSALSSSHSIGMTAGTNITLGGSLSVPAGGSISAVATTGSITSSAGTMISSGGSPVRLSAPMGSVSTSGASFASDTVPIISDGTAAAAAAAAEAAAKAAADAAAKAAADAAAAAAAEAAAKAAADAAAKAAADAAAKAAADAAAKAAADAAAKAAADAAAKAAADAAAKAAADAAAAAAAQGQQNQPVTQAINSTVNIINASVNTSQSKGSSTATVPEQRVASSSASSGNSAPDEKTVEDKNVDGSAKNSSGAAKEQVKKMYCN